MLGSPEVVYYYSGNKLIKNIMCFFYVVPDKVTKCYKIEEDSSRFKGYCGGVGFKK